MALWEIAAGDAERNEVLLLRQALHRYRCPPRRIAKPELARIDLVHYAAVCPGRPGAVQTANVPRLLRRRDTAASAASSADYADLTPEVYPSGASAIAQANRIGASASARGGIVRPTSLGIMAAIVLYSPLPLYPAAATTAHVGGGGQGGG